MEADGGAPRTPEEAGAVPRRHTSTLAARALIRVEVDVVIALTAVGNY